MSAEPTIIQKIALAVFKDRKLLMVRSAKHPDAFFNLGGKVEEGEDDFTCLTREVLEEVSAKIKEGSVRFLEEFEAPAHGKENTFVNIRLYTGDLETEPVPSSEVEEVRYFDSSINQKHLTPVSSQIFDWLKKEDYID